MVPDELIPGTLNAGHTLPVILQAFIYISAIEVDVATLVLMIASAVVGAWFGAGLVARLPRRAVQLGMGFGLLTAASVMLASQLGLFPAGGTAFGLRGWLLVTAVAGNPNSILLANLHAAVHCPRLNPWSTRAQREYRAMRIVRVDVREKFSSNLSVHRRRCHIR